MVGRSYHRPIILKIVVFLESSVICYSAHLSYLKKNNKSKPPPQTNFRALLSNHQCLFNSTIMNVIVWWSTALTTQTSQYNCRNGKAEINHCWRYFFYYGKRSDGKKIHPFRNLKKFFHLIWKTIFHLIFLWQS